MGAGFPVLASDIEKNPLPTGINLASELSETFDVSADGLDLPEICAIIESTRKSQLRAYLTRRFTVVDYDPRYHGIEGLNLETIFTTNIDDLVFKIYAGSRSQYLNRLDSGGPSFGNRAAIDIVNLHGFVGEDHRPYRFGALDLASSFSENENGWRLLARRLHETPTLFWGYSLKDGATLRTLNEPLPIGRVHADKWIIVHPDAPEMSRTYFRTLGFKIIDGDTDSFLSYLESRRKTSPQPAAVNLKAAGEFIERYSLPTAGSLPVRPVRDFFLGEQPGWYDIFYHNIPKTHFYSEVRDAISSGKHVALVGVPASGKTTLMMQVASSGIRDSVHALYVNEAMVLDQARVLIRQLNGEAALLFVDNFLDSLLAVVELLKVHNIQVVLADRDYRF